MADQQEEYRRHVERLKRDIDLNDLFERLHVTRQGGVGREGNAQYLATWRGEKHASVGVYMKDGEWRWKDYGDESGGSAIDLVMKVEGGDFKSAVAKLCEWYGMPMPRAGGDKPRERVQETLWEMIARESLVTADQAYGYLRERRIPDEVTARAIKARMLGFRDWRNPNRAEGEPGHGGPGITFIMRTLNPGHVAAVETRYIDPKLNGDVKNNCQGDKSGAFWCSNPRRLMSDAVQKVYIAEGPINALSIEAAELPYTAAIATMGKGNIRGTDWRFLKGKQVYICMDHTDKVNTKEGSEMYGYRPGLRAAWDLHERLLAVDVAARMVDQQSWGEGMDVNDMLKKDPAMLKSLLIDIEDCLIPGMPGEPKLSGGKSRIFLAGHHFWNYRKFRVNDDATRIHIGDTVTKNPDDTETVTPKFADVCSFRVAGISRIKVQSDIATMTGDKDMSPETLFSVSVQVPRHGAELRRKVFEDRHLHKTDKWEEFGAILDPKAFKRMVSVLETTTEIGARNAVNFVGLAWRDGKPVVNEGADCYFEDPKNQCTYWNLAFPTGTPAEARRSIEAYAAMFKDNVALFSLVWVLGAHLKAFLGFWPHFKMEGKKGSGKSTLIGFLTRHTGIQMKSGQSMQSDFRIVSSVSYTSHPVGWEEFSARDVKIQQNVQRILQESYNYNPTTRTQNQTKYLICAPVLLAGEDVPVDNILGKVIQVNLTGRQGVLPPDDLPRFPVRQWLEFLATKDRAEIRATHKRLHEHCKERSRADGNDKGSDRIAENYAAILTAWGLLTEFAGMDTQQFDFGRDVIKSMNAFIAETKGQREPWVWIVERVLSEMAMRTTTFPYKFERLAANDVEDGGEGRRVLLVRTQFMLDHMSRTNALRDVWNALPIKSNRAFAAQLEDAGVLVMGKNGKPQEFERTLGEHEASGTPGRRVAHMVALDLDRLAEYGIYAVGDADVVAAPNSALGSI